MGLKLIKIRSGFEGRDISYVASVCEFMFGTDFTSEEEIIFPESFEGLPLTHLGYSENYTPEHVKDHDWHHPSRGNGDYCPKEYYPWPGPSPYFPDSIKRIFIPKTVQYISNDFFDKATKELCPYLVIEIDKENPYYEVIDNKIIKKK